MLKQSSFFKEENVKLFDVFGVFDECPLQNVESHSSKTHCFEDVLGDFMILASFIAHFLRTSLILLDVFISTGFPEAWGSYLAHGSNLIAVPRDSSRWVRGPGSVCCSSVSRISPSKCPECLPNASSSVSRMSPAVSGGWEGWGWVGWVGWW